MVLQSKLGLSIGITGIYEFFIKFESLMKQMSDSIDIKRFNKHLSKN